MRISTVHVPETIADEMSNIQYEVSFDEVL